MALALKKVKVYGKLAVTAAVALAILLIVLKNSGRTVDVWLFSEYQDIPVLVLIFVTAIASVAVWWGMSKIVGIWREVRELRRLRAEEQRSESHRRASEELSEREKRIDEKIRRSLNDEN